jgi:error-prone DNA polymerase
MGCLPDFHKNPTRKTNRKGNALSLAQEIMNLPDYAELHTISNYSFLRGASHPDELVERAYELAYQAIAITDECSVSGIVKAHVAAKTLGIQLLIGSEFHLDSTLGLVLLARSRKGYQQLCSLISLARRNAKKGSYKLSREQLQQHQTSECLLLYLPNGSYNYPDLNWLKEYAAGRLWLAAERSLQFEESKALQRLKRLSIGSGVPICASGNVHMHRRERRALRDVIDAIRYGCLLSELGYRGHKNAELYLRSRNYLKALYPTEWLRQTVEIAAQCHFSLDELRYEYPAELVPEGHSAISWLTDLTEQGAAQRWPQGVPTRVRTQITHELALIKELRFEHYFLTVEDIVRFARKQGILHQGRGSAANSVICFCLHITEVDPARMSLLFERFISRERQEPPDIDVDFEHERREEVIQYIYEKYGRDRAALAATVITFRTKSALREVGKVFGIPTDKIDRLSIHSRWREKEIFSPDGDEELKNIGLSTGQLAIQLWLDLADQLIGFPRHLSQHVGGFVIARNTLSDLVPVENAAMPARTVIQWEKDDLKALGLLKIDILALGMLSMLRRSLNYLSQMTGKTWRLSDIPAEDPRVYEMIQRGDTVGVFQIESRAQMSMLPRLKPANYYDLVIQIAIVRPGPIQGDMVHPYLARRNGLEQVSYANDEIKAVLERTLGVPIFQEQVMQLAMVAAGFSAGEADNLRRSMAAWKRRGGLDKFEHKLIQGMTDNGYPIEFAEQIFRQIRGFGEYGFPESHSASFALLAYASSWFKCYYPEVFVCALLNSQPMGFYAPGQLIYDARRHGVNILPADIRHSDEDNQLVKTLAEQPDSSLDKYPSCSANSIPDKLSVRLGLRQTKGLSKKSMALIIELRRKLYEQGKLITAEDLQNHRFPQHDLRALAAANALKEISGHRHQAVWDITKLTTGVGDDLLQNNYKKDVSPLLRKPSIGEEVVKDYQSTGFSLQSHPLALLRESFQSLGYLDSSQCWQARDGSYVGCAGLVVGRQRPGTASGVVFVSLEDEYGILNVIVWPAIAEKYRQALLCSRLLLVKGQLQVQQGVLHLIAGYLADCSHYLNDLPVVSRDFH